MTVVRTRRELIVYDDHYMAALSAGIWAVLPTQLFLRVLDAFNTDWWALFYIFIPTMLIIVIMQMAVMAFAFLAFGWLIEKMMHRKGLWSWFPFALAGATLLISAILLTWLRSEGWPQLWFLALIALIGAHAGWRYYLRLCDETEVAA